MDFYRYEAQEYASLDYDGEYYRPSIPNLKLELRTFNLYKETPKGYWIGYGSMGEGKLKSQGRWVSKTARNRYAYPTKEEALHNFIKRTESKIKILKYQLFSSEIALGRGLGLKKEYETKIT